MPSAKTITAIAIAPPPTPSSPARKPPLSPSASSSRIVGRSSASVALPGAEAERDRQPQAEHAGEDRERDPEPALGDAGVDARAQHGPAEAADDEDRARLGLERAAGRDRVGDGGDDGDREDRQQRGPRRRVAGEAGAPDQAGDDDDPAADAEQAGQQPGRDADERRGGASRAGALAQQQLSHAQVVRRRDLEVLRRRLHHPHRTPAALDQPRIVGGRARARRRRRPERARAPRAGTPAASGSPTAACGRASPSRGGRPRPA